MSRLSATIWPLAIAVVLFSCSTEPTPSLTDISGTWRLTVSYSGRGLSCHIDTIAVTLTPLSPGPPALYNAHFVGGAGTCNFNAQDHAVFGGDYFTNSVFYTADSVHIDLGATGYTGIDHGPRMSGKYAGLIFWVPFNDTLTVRGTWSATLQ